MIEVTLAWREIALVAIGGSAGAVARYMVGKAMGPTVNASVPWHTFLVNVSGAFLLGLLVVLAARLGLPGWWRPLLAVGLLGGYTTFSTYSVEAVELALTGRPWIAVLYAFGSLAAGLIGAGLGIVAGRTLA